MFYFYALLEKVFLKVCILPYSVKEVELWRTIVNIKRFFKVIVVKGW